MKTPVKIAFVTVVVTQLMAWLLAWPLGYGHAGLTLATSLGACVNATLLFWLLRKHGFFAPQPGWAPFLGKVLVALAVLAAVLAWLAGPSSYWLAASLWQKVGRLGGVIAAGAVAYFAALYLLGFRLRDFNRRETADPRLDLPADSE